MPEMNGYEFCRRVKGDESLQNIPVILLTALTNAQDVLEGLVCGAHGFITKPYSEEYLLKHIERTLSESSSYLKERAHVEVEFPLAGKSRVIDLDPQQLLRLLLSTYEAAMYRNDELAKSQSELSSLNSHLEELVKQRTAELSAEITERKRLHEELEISQQREREARELASLEQISRGSQTSATEQSFGMLRLQQSAPEYFAALVKRFEQNLDLSVEKRILKIEHNVDEELRSIATQLGSVKAGPRDVIDIYLRALKDLSRDAKPQKAQVIAEEGRLIVLRLMGNLVSFYKK